jgi:hypothetical protein
MAPTRPRGHIAWRIPCADAAGLCAWRRAVEVGPSAWASRTADAALLTTHRDASVHNDVGGRGGLTGNHQGGSERHTPPPTTNNGSRSTWPLALHAKRSCTAAFSCWSGSGCSVHRSCGGDTCAERVVAGGRCRRHGPASGPTLEPRADRRHRAPGVCDGGDGHRRGAVGPGRSLEACARSVASRARPGRTERAPSRGRRYDPTRDLRDRPDAIWQRAASARSKRALPAAALR